MSSVTSNSADSSASRSAAGKNSASKVSAGKAPATAANAAKAASKGKLPKEHLVRALTEMLRARLNDEKSITLYKQNKCHFQIGCAGHEAVGVAAGHAMRPGKDWFYPYYREMGLCSALGMTSREFMLNAMNKADDPNSHGRQMPMHYGHKKLNIVNQSSPTGTQFLQAVGCALAMKQQGEDAVVYVSAGEGTTSQGDFHEALNWAAREKLPVIFSIQNNMYAISVHVSEQMAGSVYDFGAGYKGLARAEVDGTDYTQALAVFQEAQERARRGDGPTLIEAHVPRLQSHSISDNHLKYRSAADIEKEQQRDPITRLRSYLLDTKMMTAQELDALHVAIKREVDEAAEWAEVQPNCDPARALEPNFANPTPWEGIPDVAPTSGPDSYLVDSLNHALDEELAREPKMVIFGQDVAHGKGGVFTVTTGLTAKYGKNRVFNAPLAESSIVGVAIGMATVGMKPVAEIQFGDYIWTAMMQLRNELAMMHYRSDGDFSCPAVIRVPVGGYIHGGIYHSQNIEATFAHFPGLYICYPSNAADAKGLLKAAIRGRDPVLFLEHKGLYRQVYAKGIEGGEDYLVPLGKARIVREGSDVTVVTYGALVQKSIVAARELEKEGINVEIIDLRTIVPFDAATVFASVRKTGRVLIAHEDMEFVGFGAEISAQISDQCFTSLDAPVKRLGMKYAACIPHSGELEQAILPQNEDVLRAIRDLLAF